MPQTFALENAKSGRSSCKKCKEKIGKGEVRLGVSSPGPGDYEVTSWYHPKCYNLGRAYKSMGAEDFVDEHVVDNTDKNILSNSKKKAEIVDAIASQPATKKAGDDGADGGGGGGSDFKGTMVSIRGIVQKVRQLEDGDAEDDDDEPKKKKRKKDEAKKSSKKSSKGDRALEDAFGFYEGKKGDELKDYLRWNRQVGVSGTKDEVLFKCIDGYIHGRLGYCPTCEKGKLKLSKDDTNKVLCGGWFDEETQARHTCSFTCTKADAPRLQPWYKEEPTEEEKEAMDAEKEAGAGATAAGGTVKTEDILSAIMSKVDDMEWDVSNPPAIKATTKELVSILQDSGKVNISDDGKKGRMEVGKIIMAERDLTPEEICKVIIDRLGIKKTKEEEEEKDKRMAGTCANPKNGPVYEAIVQLSTCYFKESNPNAGGTYNKVAAAIQKLPYEITEDNALGMHKKKTKVEGVGKGSAEKIYEFLTTGKIEKLEEKKAALGMA